MLAFPYILHITIFHEDMSIIQLVFVLCYTTGCAWILFSPPVKLELFRLEQSG